MPVIVMVFLLCTSCYEFASLPGITGEGPIVSKTIDIRDVDGISIHNNADVILSQGNKQKIRIEAQENILDNLRTEVDGSVWRISNHRRVKKAEPIKIYMTIEDLRVARISGSGSITGTERFDDLDDLEIKISGSGDIELDVEAEDIFSRISGSGTIELGGRASLIECLISGSGDLFAEGLKTERGYTRISGSGGVRVNCTDKLEVRISGSGDVYYKGNPRIQSRISGSGNLISR